MRSPKGVTAELQVNTKTMIVAKEKGHHLYEEARTIAANAAKDNRDMTLEEKSEFDRLAAEQEKMYSKAWQASQGEQP
jgi:hypothetical protein